MANGQWFLKFHFPFTAHHPYSYGDSAGLAPDFPFNPGTSAGNQIRHKSK